jgi:hypothetical protein
VTPSPLLSPVSESAASLPATAAFQLTDHLLAL